MALDYRDAVTMKERPEKRGKAGYVQPRWWEQSEEADLAQSVLDVGANLENLSGDRLASLVRHARLYENCELDTLAGRDYAAAIVRQIVTGAGSMTFNVTAACVDTLAAKIAKNRPRPNFLTSGGSWDQQIKARNLDKFMRGLFYETRIYQKAQHVFVDGCEFGTGFLHVYPCDDNRLDCERVLAEEIFVDDLDGQYGSPRQMMRRKFVPRDILVSLFPKKANEIMEAGKKSQVEAHYNGSEEVVENTVEVWEAWHLPSGRKMKDGKHVIVIDNCVLYEERWNIDKFPFVVFRYKRRTTGYWGKGVVESVAGIQIELNRLVRSISEQLRRKGRGRIFLPMGSKVNPSHLTNGIGDIIFHTPGMPPTVDNNNAVAPEEFMQIDRLYQRAFQEIGVSELSAAAKKPSGLDAAVALREYNDIESERFALVHQAWEQFFLDYAELCIDLIKSQYGWRGYNIKLPSKRHVIEVDWAAIDLDRDSYIMQMFPTSSLPQTPAARYAKVKEMMQDGFIDKPVAQRLLEFPDLEAESNLGNAIIDDVDATISAVLDAEEPRLMPLEPYQNLDLLIQRANAAYLYARHHACPEERLSLLRNLIDNATAQKAAAMAPPPAMAAPPAPPAPGGGPGMPPMVQGDLTVNAAAPPMPVVPPVLGG